MAAAPDSSDDEFRSDGREEAKIGWKDAEDQRSYVRNPTDMKKTILALKIYKTCECGKACECGKTDCKCKVQAGAEYALGTCFMLNDLYKNVKGIPKQSFKFHYFVTAAHNLVCRSCWGQRSMYVRLATHWNAGEASPDKPLLKEITEKKEEGQGNPAVGLETYEFGWTKYPREYQKAKNQYERFAYDYGLIAIRRTAIADEFAKVPGRGTVPLLECDPDLKEFYEKANICGYPAYVYGEADKMSLPETASETFKKLSALGDGGVDHVAHFVAGAMYWVDPKNQCPSGFPSEEDDEPKHRYKEERNTSALYGMPQNHSKDEKKETDASTDTELCRKNLFRHYIDASSGQSGSPVYVTGHSGLSRVYKAVGIHVGYWPFTGEYKDVRGPINCNVAVRLTGEVLTNMQKWIADYADVEEDQTDEGFFMPDNTDKDHVNHPEEGEHKTRAPVGRQPLRS